MNYTQATKALVAYGYPGPQARNALDAAVAHNEGEAPDLKMMLSGQWHFIRYGSITGFYFVPVITP